MVKILPQIEISVKDFKNVIRRSQIKLIQIRFEGLNQTKSVPQSFFW